MYNERSEYIFELGFEAYRNGEKLTDNPYGRPVNREIWEDGWQTAFDWEDGELTLTNDCISL